MCLASTRARLPDDRDDEREGNAPGLREGRAGEATRAGFDEDEPAARSFWLTRAIADELNVEALVQMSRTLRTFSCGSKERWSACVRREEADRGR